MPPGERSGRDVGSDSLGAMPLNASKKKRRRAEGKYIKEPTVFWIALNSGKSIDRLKLRR